MSVPVVPLQELCEMDRQGLQSNSPVASGLPYVGVEHVTSGTGIINLDGGSRIGAQRSATLRFDDRHVLYAKLRPYLNKVATPEFVGKCSTELVPLLPKDGIDRSFLTYILRRQATVDFVMASVTGSRMPRTDMKVLLSMPVPLPPLDEQRRIAAILNRAAKIERLRMQAQERLREFMPALFVRMFGDPGENSMEGRLVDAVQRDRGRLSVPVVPLGKICDILDRHRKPITKRDRIPGPYPYYGASGVLDRVADYIFDEPLVLVGEDGAKWGPGETSAFAIDGKTWVNNHAHVLRPRRTYLVDDWLIHYLNASDLAPFVSGITVPKLNQRRLKDIRIPLPPLAEQRRFAKIAAFARSISELGDSGARSASALTASLMSRLLEAGA